MWKEMETGASGGGGKEYNLKKGQIKVNGTVQSSLTLDKPLENGKQYSICIGSDGTIQGESGYYRNSLFTYAGSSLSVSTGQISWSITSTTISISSGDGRISANNAWVQIYEPTFLTEDE